MVLTRNSSVIRNERNEVVQPRGAEVRRPSACWSTRPITATSWPRRFTSSPKWSAIRWRATSTWRPSGFRCRWRCRSTSATSSASRSTACGTASYAGLVAKYWFERLARLPVEVDVASEFRYREAPLRARRPGDLHLAIGRDRRHAGGAALRQAQGVHTLVGGQRADLDHRARKRNRAADAGRARDRRRLDQGLHLPAHGAGGAGGRRGQGARRTVRGRRRPAGARHWSRCRG